MEAGKDAYIGKNVSVGFREEAMAWSRAEF